MSWWLDKSREEFTREIATRYAVNKAEKGHGGVQKWTTEQASRGGKSAKREYRPQAVDREKRMA